MAAGDVIQIMYRKPQGKSFRSLASGPLDCRTQSWEQGMDPCDVTVMLQQWGRQDVRLGYIFFHFSVFCCWMRRVRSHKAGASLPALPQMAYRVLYFSKKNVTFLAQSKWRHFTSSSMTVIFTYSICIYCIIYRQVSIAHLEVFTQSDSMRGRKSHQKKRTFYRHSPYLYIILSLFSPIGFQVTSSLHLGSFWFHLIASA